MSINAKQYYANGYTNHSIVGVDEFGRVVMPASGSRDGDHQVGMFYYLHRGNAGDGIYDISKILQLEDGYNKLLYQDCPESPANNTHWWGEPLYGYYNAREKWVIRRHLELFAYSGIDFIMIDGTNGSSHDFALMNVMEVIRDLVKEGMNPPKVAMYTNVESPRQITELYEQFYKVGFCQESWYCLDGKPLIVGTELDQLSEEIREFFTFRDSQWPTFEFNDNGFPWVEFEYPAKPHNGIMNVAVSANTKIHYSYYFTQPEYNWSWGKGWDVNLQKNIHEDAARGTYYQSTWDVALEADPRIIFCTQWNEWTAQKNRFSWEGKNYGFVDVATMEFSRDMEPMKGGYNDAFVIQTALNARKFKSVLIPEGESLDYRPVDVKNIRWEEIPAVFRAWGTKNLERDYPAFGPPMQYKQEAARNNVVEIRVAMDDDHVYFHLKSTDPITAYEAGDSTWMNLFIGTGNVARKGWESYEYVVNRSILSDGIGSVEKLNEDFTGTQVGTAAYTVEGNTMTVSLPRAAIGLESDYAFYFKFADHITAPSDIMDYYLSGKSLPVGRFSFQYLGE